MGKRGGWRWGRKRHGLPMDSFADAIKSSSLLVNLPEGFADGHFRRCQRKLSAKTFNPVFLRASINKTGCFTDNLKTSVKLPISVVDPERLRNVHKPSDVYHGKDRNSLLCIHYTPHPRLREGEELEWLKASCGLDGILRALRPSHSSAEFFMSVGSWQPGIWPRLWVLSHDKERFVTVVCLNVFYSCISYDKHGLQPWLGVMEMR